MAILDDPKIEARVKELRDEQFKAAIAEARRQFDLDDLSDARVRGSLEMIIEKMRAVVLPPPPTDGD